jgi:dTDP-L-rhamnose 4-epimerase
MNIMITGGAGFIGSHLCKRLVKDGHKVFVLDNMSPQVHGRERSEISDLVYHFVNGDAATTWGTQGILRQGEFDAIICLAAETGTGQSMFEAQRYCNTNIGTIAALNDLLIKGKNKELITCIHKDRDGSEVLMFMDGPIKTKKVILASSRAVYGEANLDEDGNPIATKETDDKDPRSIYAITKLAQEQILFTGFPDTPVCALRFQNVYGPGQSLKNPYTGILSIFSTALKNGKDIQVFGDGMMSRDFVYIDDVVDSIVLAIESDFANGEVFNVGSGVPTTVLKVAQTLKEKYDSSSNINITGESMKGDIRHNFADISKIRKIGFEPKVSFDEGIQKFVDWVDSKGEISYNDYENSLDEFRKKGLLK